MSNLSTVQVLEILDDHIFDQMLRCDLLRYAVKGMVNEEDNTMRLGCDAMIEKHLNDMICLVQRPQDLLMEHIEFLKTHEMCKP